MQYIHLLSGATSAELSGSRSSGVAWVEGHVGALTSSVVDRGGLLVREERGFSLLRLGQVEGEREML